MLTSLVALQNADTAFPSGAFAFSNGIEGLASLPHPFQIDALTNYVEATLRHRWNAMDRRALVHAYRAAGDIDRAAAIDRSMETASLAEPFRTGSRRAGKALLITHVRLATPEAERLRDAIAAGRMLGHLAVIQGCLWRVLGISEAEAAMMAGYQTIAGLVSAAVRLGRVGAIDGQRVIRDSLPVLATILSEPVPYDDAVELESFAPLVDIASMRGADDGARLFSN